MTKSATQVMQELLFSAVVDSIQALKASSKGIPNTLLRELGSVHANTAFPDLPESLQAAIVAAVRSSFTRLLKEGYEVSPRGASPAPRTHASQPVRPDRPGRPGGRRPPPKRGGPGRPNAARNNRGNQPPKPRKP